MQFFYNTPTKKTSWNYTEIYVRLIINMNKINENPHFFKTGEMN